MTAKLTIVNGEQVIHLPRGIHLPGSEADVRIEGGTLILRPRPDSWDEFFSKPSIVPDDFLTARVDPLPETRDAL